jgi:hypothetical protein
MPTPLLCLLQLWIILEPPSTIKKGNKMFIYLVKSFGPQLGYQNLKAFGNLIDAEKYQTVIQKQIPEDIQDEFVEIETLSVE